jgi:NADH-quinone oxidoreductase subunit L
MVYAKGRLKPVEPELLERGWRYDEAVSAFMGGPGRQGFEAVAWFDANVVDGAVVGTGRAVRSLGQITRKSQPGFVRAYAVVVALGAVVMMAWFLLRGLL